MFGKTQRGVSERPNKPKKPLIPTWLGTLVVVLLILCFLVALMLWKPWEPVKPRTNQIQSEHYQEETNNDYRFYDLLPKQQVTPIPEQAVPETRTAENTMIVETPAAPASSEATAAPQNGETAAPVIAESFILQVKSYTDPDQADARRAEIILNGLSADVVQTIENEQVWYRVISGPYASQDAAMIAQQTLQHSGIDSIVIKR